MRCQLCEKQISKWVGVCDCQPPPDAPKDAGRFETFNPFKEFGISVTREDDTQPPAIKQESARKYKVDASVVLEYRKQMNRRVEILEAQLSKAREALEWMNRKGGLGFDVHKRIDEALAQLGEATT